MTYTEAQKRAIMKWRNKNKERYCSYLREHNTVVYKAEERSKRYYWAKEAKIFKNILLD